MPFTTELWNAVSPIYAAILRHPFVTGLTDGSLPRETFRFYAVQDALYLREFARALSLAAARAPREEWIIMFNEHAAGALKVERDAARGLLRGLRPHARGRRGDAARPDQRGLHELSPRRGLRLAVSRGGGRAPALLLDLLGGGQGARARGARPIRSTRAGSAPTPPRSSAASCARCSRAPTPSPRTSAPAERDAMTAPLHDDEPLRVDVLGHGASPRGVAGLTRALVP